MSEFESDPTSCNCDHVGKSVLDETYNLNIEKLYDCLFGRNEFHSRFCKKRKIADMKTGEWDIHTVDENTHKIRSVEYSMLIANKKLTSVITERHLENLENRLHVMECESISYGIPYSDTFVVVTRVCFTRISDSLSRLRVHVKVNFSDRTRQFLKDECLNQEIEKIKELERIPNGSIDHTDETLNLVNEPIELKCQTNTAEILDDSNNKVLSECCESVQDTTPKDNILPVVCKTFSSKSTLSLKKICKCTCCYCTDKNNIKKDEGISWLTLALLMILLAVLFLNAKLYIKLKNIEGIAELLTKNSKNVVRNT